jgi:hypothetical protein
MEICFFLQWHPIQPQAAVSELDATGRHRLLETIREWGADPGGLKRVAIQTPTDASDRYLNDRNGPVLTLQCYFDELGELESALLPQGAFERLLSAQALERLGADPGIEVTQQAMVVRTFDLDGGSPHFEGTRCTYQVTYTSEQANIDVWLADYLAHHVPLLKMQPGLLEMEVYTRLDWVTSLPCGRGTAVQRNKAVFANPAALSAALHSPVRDALHRHSQNAPPLHGGSTHFPMASEVVWFDRNRA